MNTGRGEESSLPAGGPARHIPVLLDEAIAALSPRSDGVYLDNFKIAMVDAPEPATLGVLAIGVVGMLGLRRRS